MKAKLLLIVMVLFSVTFANAQEAIQYKPAPKEITTAVKSKTKIGTLSYPEGYPLEETAQILVNEKL